MKSGYDWNHEEQHSSDDITSSYVVECRGKTIGLNNWTCGVKKKKYIKTNYMERSELRVANCVRERGEWTNANKGDGVS